MTLGPPEETYLVVEAIGLSLLGKVSLTLDYRTSVPNSFAPPKADGPYRFPTRFEAWQRRPGELSGSWQTTTIWMVGPRRRLVPVILAEGTWLVQRSTG